MGDPYIKYGKDLFSFQYDDGTFKVNNDNIIDIISLLFSDLLTDVTSFSEPPKEIPDEIENEQKDAWKVYMTVKPYIKLNKNELKKRFDIVTNSLSSPTEDEREWFWGQPIFDKARKDIEDQIHRARYQPTGVKGVFTCEKCKNREVFYHEQQTRTCDEGMTIFLTCMKCHHKWTLH